MKFRTARAKKEVPKYKIPNLYGKRIVVTGKIEDYTRREISDILTRHGCIVEYNIKRTTDLLLVGERPGRSKLELSVLNNIHTISYDDIKPLIGID